jgi:hypothetical protein
MAAGFMAALTGFGRFATVRRFLRPRSTRPAFSPPNSTEFLPLIIRAAASDCFCEFFRLTLRLSATVSGQTPEGELEALRAAVLEDKSHGRAPDVTEGQTGKWYTKALKEAGKGAVKAGIDVVSSVIVKAIKGYTTGET